MLGPMSGATVSHPHALRLFEHRVNGWLVIAVQGEVEAERRDEAAAQLTVRLRSVTCRGRDAVAVDLSALGAGAPLDSALLSQGRELVTQGRSIAVVVPGSGAPSTLDGDLLRVAALADLPPIPARFGRWS